MRMGLQAEREASHLELVSRYDTSAWAREVHRVVSLASHRKRSPSLASEQQLRTTLPTSRHFVAAVATLIKVGTHLMQMPSLSLGLLTI